MRKRSFVSGVSWIFEEGDMKLLFRISFFESLLRSKIFSLELRLRNSRFERKDSNVRSGAPVSKLQIRKKKVRISTLDSSFETLLSNLYSETPSLEIPPTYLRSGALDSKPFFRISTPEFHFRDFSF